MKYEINSKDFFFFFYFYFHFPFSSFKGTTIKKYKFFRASEELFKKQKVTSQKSSL